MLENIYSACEYKFPLIAAILEGRQKGRVYTNSVHNPTHVFVINKFGFCQEFNSSFDSTFFNKVKHIIKARQYNRLRMYAPTQLMREFLLGLDFSSLSRRYQFTFSTPVNNTSPDVPYPWNVRNIVKDDLRQTHFGLDLTGRYWNGQDDFLENALAVGVFLENNILGGICYAAGIGLYKAEIDIYVDEKYRNLGLGIAMTQKFINNCIKKGITPNWDCYANNIHSVTLGEKTDFHEKKEYDFFNINGHL